jgi:glutamate-1-semialdehyde 2,1-aminomutase
MQKGIYWPPSQFEAAFVSTEHRNRELDATLEAIKEVLS